VGKQFSGESLRPAQYLQGGVAGHDETKVGTHYPYGYVTGQAYLMNGGLYFH
jgi:hypothetical protein